jgi:hypothetical protein
VRLIPAAVLALDALDGFGCRSTTNDIRVDTGEDDHAFVSSSSESARAAESALTPTPCPKAAATAQPPTQVVDSAAVAGAEQKASAGDWQGALSLLATVSATGAGARYARVIHRVPGRRERRPLPGWCSESERSFVGTSSRYTALTERGAFRRAQTSASNSRLAATMRSATSFRAAMASGVALSSS